MTKRSQFAIGVRTKRAKPAKRRVNPGSDYSVGREAGLSGEPRKTALRNHLEWVEKIQMGRRLAPGEKRIAIQRFNEAYAIAARSKSNPWPFSKKAAAPARLKSSLTIAQAVREAKAAGYRGTDFNEWLERKRLEDRSSSQLSTLGAAYRSGMDAKEAEREKIERGRSEARRAREEAAERKRQDREEERAEKAHKQEKTERKARALESFKPDDEKLDRHFRKGGTLAQFLAGEIRNPSRGGWQVWSSSWSGLSGKAIPERVLFGGQVFASKKAAQEAWYDTAPGRNDRAAYVKVKSNPKRRRNPGTPADAQAAYEEFHGKPSNESVRITRRVHFHKNLASAGQLRSLILKSVGGKKIRIRFTKDTLLTFNTAKNQLFVTGGDQSIDDLKPYGIRSPHEIETLGKVISLDYFTTKDHLGDEGGTAVYRHKLRTTNQNGQHVTVRVARYPDLIYYTRDRRMEFSGGSYEIIAEGIDK